MPVLPKRPKQHVIDDLAVDVFRNAIHRKGWVYRELSNDYGIDAEVEVRNSNQEMTGALVRFQIKGCESAMSPLRVKVQSFRYWTISPIPVFIVRVTPKNKKFRIVDVNDYASIINFNDSYRSSKRKTMTIDFRHAITLVDWDEYLLEVAIEHHHAVLDTSKYTLYNPVYQEISRQRLFRQHNGDIHKMIKWYREEVPDDQLVYEFGHAVYLKEQIESDPTFLEKLREYVYSWDQ